MNWSILAKKMTHPHLMWQQMENLESEISRSLTMNRSQRRQQQRAEKKAQQKAGTYSIDMEMIQPWSDVLMKVKLPDEIIDAMLEITDTVLQDPDRKNWGDNLAGQIADEPLIPHEMMQKHQISQGGSVFEFLMNVVGEYVK